MLYQMGMTPPNLNLQKMTSKDGFFIFKNKDKKSEKQPDYRVTKKVGEEWLPVGACWKKYDKNGEPFFSCVMDEPKDTAKDKEADIKYDEL